MSASINATISDFEFLKPVFIAAPLPKFVLWFNTFAPADNASCTVLSVDPSFTTNTSSI